MLTPDEQEELKAWKDLKDEYITNENHSDFLCNCIKYKMGFDLSRDIGKDMLDTINAALPINPEGFRQTFDGNKPYSKQRRIDFCQKQIERLERKL